MIKIRLEINKKEKANPFILKNDEALNRLTKKMRTGEMTKRD